ncbi:hypothetical protein [Peribacillus sp. ACCC06369]|nr:hypothetical protein [Peribacillus sp. ACCC06369]
MEETLLQLVDKLADQDLDYLHISVAAFGTDQSVMITIRHP